MDRWALGETMNLIPIWWRLESIPELAPYPKEERRRLFGEAWKQTHQPYMWWIIGAYGVTFTFISQLASRVGEMLGRYGIFSAWAGLIKAASDGLLDFPPAWIARMLAIIVLTLPVIMAPGILLQGKVLRRLREMVARA
jgi:hypothetical protein